MRKIEEILSDLLNAEEKLAVFKAARDDAENAYRTESTRLSNLRNELTKAVAPLVDFSTLENTDAYRKRPKSYPVNTP